MQAKEIEGFNVSFTHFLQSLILFFFKEFILSFLPV